MGPYLNSERSRSLSDADTPAAPVLTEEAGPLPVRDFLPAIGAHISEPARFSSHPEEAERLIRNPINQARLALASLVITNRTVGSARCRHRERCGCLHFEDCPSEWARQQRDAEIRARQVEIEIRGYLDMAQGVGA